MTKKQKANEDAEKPETEKTDIDGNVKEVENAVDDMVEIKNQYGETKKVKKSSII